MTKLEKMARCFIMADQINTHRLTLLNFMFNFYLFFLSIFYMNISAEKVDWKYIYIKCPYCVRNVNKFRDRDEVIENGSKYKRVYHIYNSNNNFENRQIKVKSNCIFMKNHFFNISIDDSTLKIPK